MVHLKVGKNDQKKERYMGYSYSAILIINKLVFCNLNMYLKKNTFRNMPWPTSGTSNLLIIPEYLHNSKWTECLTG